MIKTEDILIDRLIDPLWDVSTKDRIEEIASMLKIYLFPYAKLDIRSIEINVVFEEENKKAFLIMDSALEILNVENIEFTSIRFSVDPENFGIFIKLTYEDNKVMIQPYE